MQQVKWCQVKKRKKKQVSHTFLLKYISVQPSGCCALCEAIKAKPKRITL